MPYYDISDATLQSLGLTLAGSTGAVNVPASLRWDCSIGGLPFLYGMSTQHPMNRETASFRRDRVDTGASPSEQSLDSGMWLRSQSSWHYGSGISSAEPLEVSDTEAHFRYQRGGGVNPWTAGQMTLLNDTEVMLASSGLTQTLIGVDTGVLHSNSTTLTYITNAGSTSAVTWGGSGTAISSVASDGANYYAANSTAIYKGALPSSAGTLLWNTGASTISRWVKSRLMAAVGASLYELVGTGPALPTALFTHPSAGWTWTDFAEGPTSIYVSGYTGDTSIIYRIGVTSSASSITLAQPVVVAELPRGELVRGLYSYVGTYLVVGTTKGARVATMNSDGSLTLGPLVAESSDGCFDAVADGSFVYVTMGSKGEAGDRVQRAGLYRVDLGTSMNGNPLKFAAAADLVVPSGGTGLAYQVTTAGGKLWFATSGNGVYRQSVNYVAEGWAETGRIRMGMVESKAWRDVRVLMDSTSAGSVTAYASTVGAVAPSGWTSVVSVTSGVADATGTLNAAASTPAASLYLAFKLVRGSTTTAPTFIGYQLKAVPAPKRTELLSLPLMCYDFEVCRTGTRYGQDNGSYARYHLLKLMENAAATVTFRDYSTGETAEAFIEKVSFARTTPPSRQTNGNGGIVTLLLRLV